MTFASIKALADAKASEVVMFAAKSHSRRSPNGFAMRSVAPRARNQVRAVLARGSKPESRENRSGGGYRPFCQGI